MLSFLYILDGAGWATATLGYKGRQVVMTVSYLHDSLGELARAAIDIRDGRDSASVLFMDEPGEHLLVVEREDGDVVRMEVRWFGDWASWGIQPADQYKKLFEARCTVTEFVMTVRGVLNRVLEEWGTEGYEHMWVEHSFPIEEHGRLSEGIRD